MIIFIIDHLHKACVTKVCGHMEIKLPSFFSSVVNGSVWSASCSGRYIYDKKLTVVGMQLPCSGRAWSALQYYHATDAVLPDSLASNAVINITRVRFSAEVAMVCSPLRPSYESLHPSIKCIP